MDSSSLSSANFSSVGEMLKYLRRRARVSQRELSIAVGYSESHISRIENNERPIDRTSLLALFVPALEIQNDPEIITRLLTLCEQQRPPSIVTESTPVAGADINASLSSPQLPHQLTSFIGRADEVAEIGALLADKQTRLLTLSGSGGCGKTRLALRVGQEMDVHYPNGVWLAELAALTDAHLLVRSVAAVFNLGESGDGPLLFSLTNHLRSNQALLILDNCEHLVEAVAHLAADLLTGCPRLQILATSREALALPGEEIYRVHPLALPPGLLGDYASRTAIETFDAVRLFVERARQVRRGFVLTDENAAPVARICQRLDGIPLAIELAAAWMSLLTPEQIVARLENDLELLTGQHRTVPLRHQTLAAAMDWSFGLLSLKEQLLLTRLAVFAGGWTVETAESVAGAWPPLERNEILGLLKQLVMKSLVVLGHSADGVARFGLLETIREYARKKLIAGGEEEQARDRHEVCFSTLADRVKSGPDAGLDAEEFHRWLSVLDQEQENLRAALDWAHTRQTTDRELRLAVALGPFWRHRGYYAEGQRRLAAALERNQELSLLRARASLWAGILARLSGSTAEARAFSEESLALFRCFGSSVGDAKALENLGWTWYADDRQQAICYFQASLSVFRSRNRGGDCSRLLTTLAQMAREEQNLELAQSYLSEARIFAGGEDSVPILNGLAELASLDGNYEEAAQLLHQSLTLLTAAGSRQDLAWVYCGLAENCWHRRDMQTGRNYGERSVQLFRELGSETGLAIALHHLGLVCLTSNEPARALLHLHEALDLCRELRNTFMMARCQAGLAAVAIGEGEGKRSASLFDAAAGPLAEYNRQLAPADIEFYRHLQEQMSFKQ